MMWLKKYKWHVLVPVLILAALAAAYFLGDRPQTPQPQPAPPTAADTAQTPDGETVCTISVSCATLLDNPDLDADKVELVPTDGWLLAPTTLSYKEGESAFDLLARACREAKLHMEYSNTPIYDAAYIEGIGNLYEFDCGSLSGWMYRVNGEFPNYSSSRYTLQPGDTVEWLYTCDLGADIGGDTAFAGQQE